MDEIITPSRDGSLRRGVLRSLKTVRSRQIKERAMFSRFLCFLPALSFVLLSVGLGYVAPESTGIDMTRSAQKLR